MCAAMPLQVTGRLYVNIEFGGSGGLEGFKMCGTNNSKDCTIARSHFQCPKNHENCRTHQGTPIVVSCRLAWHALAFWTSSCHVTSLVNSLKRPTDHAHTPRIAARLFRAKFHKIGSIFVQVFRSILESIFEPSKRSPKWGLP